MPRHTGILINLIRDEKIKVFAEIGIAYGKNLKKILQSESGPMIKEYWAVDPWDPILNSGPRDGYENTCQLIPYFKQLHVIRLCSVDAAELFPTQYFDMVYIDANHSYEAVVQDIQAWLPKVKIGGILGGHDYNMSSVRRAVNELLPNAWEPPPAPRGSTKVWLYRKICPDIQKH